MNGLSQQAVEETHPVSKQHSGGVPVIDLSQDTDQLVDQIVHACSTYGFFQVINHDISPNLIQAFRRQNKLYFEDSLSVQEKREKFKRHAGNSRGYFDDEYTKQRKDWKQCLDVGMPGGDRNWHSNNVPDNHPDKACLDGLNQFPTVQDHAELGDFRRIVVQYFEACAELAHQLTVLMEQGLYQRICGTSGTNQSQTNGDVMSFVNQLRDQHTSYLRMNYYPPLTNATSTDKENDQTGPSPLGISPHKDAGYLTVLLQDDDCHSLQVWDTTSGSDGQWTTVHPIPGAFTVNTGDMAQVRSNGLYQAPLHRVLADPHKKRYSAPFFYNPGYQTKVAPVTLGNAKPRYYDILWGYFRAVRFAGDLTSDLGVEDIQIDHFEIDTAQKDETQRALSQHHLEKQKLFAQQVNVQEPFNVDMYRHLLTMTDESQ